MEITTDVFTIPYKDKYIIYAPIKGLTLLSNQSTVALLSRIRAGEKTIIENSQTGQIIEYFRRSGIIDGARDFTPVPRALAEFLPTQLTLFPTSDCNLRCVYCYASAG